MDSSAGDGGGPSSSDELPEVGISLVRSTFAYTNGAILPDLKDCLGDILEKNATNVTQLINKGYELFSVYFNFLLISKVLIKDYPNFTRSLISQIMALCYSGYSLNAPDILKVSVTKLFGNSLPTKKPGNNDEAFIEHGIREEASIEGNV